MPRKPRTSSVAELNAAPGGVAAVDKALSLLGAFGSGDLSLSLSELAERTGMYKSTALRLIASLEHSDLLQKVDAGRYAIGPGVTRLHGLYAASFSLDRVVLPVLRKVVADTGESAAYHVMRGQGEQSVRLCLYRVDSPHPVRDHIRAGDVLPSDRGTGARVLCAFDPVRAKAVSAATRRVYAGIRERGFLAATDDRLAGVAGISAPVFGAQGQIAGALTLTMPTHRFAERHTRVVLAAARALSGKV